MKGEGWGAVHGVNNMDTTGTFRKKSREFDGGGFGVRINRDRKDRGFGWGEMREGGEELF